MCIFNQCPTFSNKNQINSGFIPRLVSFYLSLQKIEELRKREKSWNKSRIDFIFIQKGWALMPKSKLAIITLLHT